VALIFVGQSQWLICYCFGHRSQDWDSSKACLWSSKKACWNERYIGWIALVCWICNVIPGFRRSIASDHGSEGQVSREAWTFGMVVSLTISSWRWSLNVLYSACYSSTTNTWSKYSYSKVLRTGTFSYRRPVFDERNTNKKDNSKKILIFDSGVPRLVQDWVGRGGDR
jgi:hypothetical protein